MTQSDLDFDDIFDEWRGWSLLGWLQAHTLFVVTVIVGVFFIAGLIWWFIRKRVKNPYAHALKKLDFLEHRMQISRELEREKIFYCGVSEIVKELLYHHAARKNFFVQGLTDGELEVAIDKIVRDDAVCAEIKYLFAQGIGAKFASIHKESVLIKSEIADLRRALGAAALKYKKDS